MFVAAFAVMALLGLGACGGDDDEPERAATDTQPATTETTATTEAPQPTKVIQRADLKSCLAAAGLKPEDTGDVVASSSGPLVTGLGVELPSGARVVFFVDQSAADAEATAQVEKNSAPAGAEVTQTGNVTGVYLSAPTAPEQATLDACLEG